MKRSVAPEKVGSPWPIRAMIAGALAVLAFVGALWTRSLVADEEARREIVIATGLPSGVYHSMGLALGRSLETHGVVDRAVVLTTEGSVENMARLSEGGPDVDLAFVQSDTPAGAEVRLLASLYDEVLHVLVRRELASEIVTIHDLAGRRVAVGPEGSGTHQVAEWVLSHFDVAPSERASVGSEEAAVGLRDGSLDAAFVLTAIPSPWVEELARSNAVRFLSLGDVTEEGSEADALALVNRSFDSVVVPRGVYGVLPTRAFRTVAVSALLVARRALEPELVRDVTRELFENRLGGDRLDERQAAVAARIREDYRPADAVLRYHAGAVAYYEREAPPFFVQYAEAISLGLTLLVGLYSAYVAAAGWMRRREKNRLDAYLLEAEHLVADLPGLSLEELVARRDALDDVRHRSFADFVAERLPVNEAFTILQDFLRSERAAIEARVRESERGR